MNSQHVDQWVLLFMFALALLAFTEYALPWIKRLVLQARGVNPDDAWDIAQIRAALEFAPSVDYSIADMANVGRALMLSIECNVPDWAPLNCPSEIVRDLINDRDDAMRRVQFLEEDMLCSAELAAVIEVFAACSSARIGSVRRDEILRKLNRRAVKAVLS